MKRWQKRLTIILAVAAVLVFAVVSGISIYVGWGLTHREREPVVKPAATGGIQFEDVSFPSREDNLMLKGWFLAAPQSNKTIIFVHGYHKNRLQDDVPALPIASALQKKGYNILMFDLRACGESPGTFISVGQFEKRDVLGALDFVKKRGKAGEHIGILAWSMGGATTLNALDEGLSAEAIVVDSVFADLRPYLEINMPVWTDLPNFPFTPLIMAYLPPIVVLDPDQVRPIEGVKSFDNPILFIHGESDTAIPYRNSQDMLKAARHKGSDLWVVPGADHVKSHETQPEEYVKRVTAFFDKFVGQQ